jgi:hypothetical protein
LLGTSAGLLAWRGKHSHAIEGRRQSFNLSQGQILIAIAFVRYSTMRRASTMFVAKKDVRNRRKMGVWINHLDGKIQRLRIRMLLTTNWTAARYRVCASQGAIVIQ